MSRSPSFPSPMFTSRLSKPNKLQSRTPKKPNTWSIRPSRRKSRRLYSQRERLPLSNKLVKRSEETPPTWNCKGLRLRRTWHAFSAAHKTVCSCSRKLCCSTCTSLSSTLNLANPRQTHTSMYEKDKNKSSESLKRNTSKLWPYHISSPSKSLFNLTNIFYLPYSSITY